MQIVQDRPSGRTAERGKTMSYTSELSQSKEYHSFRSSVPLRKIVVDTDGTKVTSCQYISYHISPHQHLFYRHFDLFMTVSRNFNHDTPR